MYVIYYVPMLQCWQLVRILVKTNHPCLRVGYHRTRHPQASSLSLDQEVSFTPLHVGWHRVAQVFL
jgi:hypothetical protein